jgi:hypothetical protein
VKVCLKTPVEDGGRVFPQGLIGRQVLRVGRKTWLVEFKYPDAFYPCRPKRVYAEVDEGDFEEIYASNPAT